MSQLFSVHWAKEGIKSKTYHCLMGKTLYQSAAQIPASWDNDYLEQMPRCNGRHLPLNNIGAEALWHTEVQIPISNQAENPCCQIVREVDVCEGENPWGHNYPWVYLRKQWPTLSFRWRCLAADLSMQTSPQDTSQQDGANLHNQIFPGVFLTACLPPGG